MPRCCSSALRAAFIWFCGTVFFGFAAAFVSAQDIIINKQPGAASEPSAPKQAQSYASDEEAQEAEENAKTPDPLDKLPAQFRDAVEQRELTKQPKRVRTRNRKSTPWLAPNGEQLVAIVEERYMTKPQLVARADLIVRGMGPALDAKDEENRRIITEDRLLSQWVEITSLATHALKQGYTVTDEEVNSALQTLADEAAKQNQGGGADARLRAIGFPEEQLRQEVRDGILVEKLVKDSVKLVFTEADLRTVYNTNPAYFALPTRVHAWQLVRPRVGPLSSEDKERVLDELNRWRGRLKRAKDDAACEAIKAEMLKNRKPDEPGIAIQNLEWVLSSSPLPSAVARELFSMKPGQTSDVIDSDVGLHVVKVFAREDPPPRSYEEVRASVEASLFEKTREIIAERLKGHYKIYMAASGLRKWEAGEPVATPAPAGKGAPAAATVADAADPLLPLPEPEAAPASAKAPAGSAPVAAATSAAARGPRFGLPPPPPAEIRAMAKPAATPAPAAGKRFSNPPPVSDVIGSRAATPAVTPKPAAPPTP